MRDEDHRRLVLPSLVVLLTKFPENRRSITLKNIEHALCEFEKYKNQMRGGRVFASRVPTLGSLPEAALNDMSTCMT